MNLQFVMYVPPALTLGEIVDLFNDGSLPAGATLKRDEDGHILFTWEVAALV
jgi:hypothetical protein